jgi:hypothetical protein
MPDLVREVLLQIRGVGWMRDEQYWPIPDKDDDWPEGDGNESEDSEYYNSKDNDGKDRDGENHDYTTPSIRHN